MTPEENSFDAIAQVPALSGQQVAVAPSSLAHVESSRAVAEVQAALVIAASRPRNELAARERILQACQRTSLAQGAVYSYPRGGGKVSGPTIRLAEACARSWGNMQYGFREIGRRVGSSEVEAWAWDLETNTKAVRQFSMTHTRDKRDGGQELTAERDIYELVANMAQRRVRACILEIVPGDIVEDAVAQCEKTCHAAISEKGKDLGKVILAMSEAFEVLGVSRLELEERLGHRLDACQPAEVLALTKVYNSLKDGYGVKADYFKPSTKAPTLGDQVEGTRTEQVSEALAAKRKGAGKVAQGVQEDAKAPAPTSAPENEDTRPPGPNLEGLDLQACRMAALEYWTGTGYEAEDAERVAGKSLPQWTRKDIDLVIGTARTQRASLADAGL